MKKEYQPFSILLMLALLVGCTQSRPETSSNKSFSNSFSAAANGSSVSQDSFSSSSSSVSVPASDSGSAVSTHKNPTNSDFFNELSLTNEALKKEILDFATFFQSPIAQASELKKDYYFSYFLLYKAFHDNTASSYAQDENLFWLIPESDLKRAAEKYLGISDFHLSSIEEWPFQPPKNGYGVFTNETSLPYCSAQIVSISFDSTTNLITAEVRMVDDQYEDSQSIENTLFYILERKEENIYQLKSISEN